jgi:hypothetical protein
MGEKRMEDTIEGYTGRGFSTEFTEFQNFLTRRRFLRIYKSALRRVGCCRKHRKLMEV